MKRAAWLFLGLLLGGCGGGRAGAPDLSAQEGHGGDATAAFFVLMGHVVLGDLRVDRARLGLSEDDLRRFARQIEETAVYTGRPRIDRSTVIVDETELGLADFPTAIEGYERVAREVVRRYFLAMGDGRADAIARSFRLLSRPRGATPEASSFEGAGASIAAAAAKTREGRGLALADVIGRTPVVRAAAPLVDGETGHRVDALAVPSFRSWEIYVDWARLERHAGWTAVLPLLALHEYVRALGRPEADRNYRWSAKLARQVYWIAPGETLPLVGGALTDFELYRR